jgi:hypothetical protein
MTTRIGRRLAAAAALVFPSAAARAQQPAAPGFRFSVEGYLAQYALGDALRLSARSPWGYGVRVVGTRRDPSRVTHSLAERATGGFFAAFTPQQGDPGVTTLHAGIQTDASFLDRPLAGVLDPFVSFGLGIFRTSIKNNTTFGNGKRVNRTDLAFTPALGTRIPFFNGVGARADLRVPIVFGVSTTVNLAAEGGLYVSF